MRRARRQRQSVRKRIIVLGGGTGWTLMANRLRRLLDRDVADIVVIDSDDGYIYQPGLLFVPFGLATPARLVRPRHRQLRRDITFRRTAVDRVDTEHDQVTLADGTVLGYDVLSSPPAPGSSRRRPKGSPARAGWRRSSPSTPWTAPPPCGRHCPGSAAGASPSP
jgi:NADPH-dependent 2,4-dienoyl-CoA reductase/sulfur reductase-like enzyme